MGGIWGKVSEGMGWGREGAPDVARNHCRELHHSTPPRLLVRLFIQLNHLQKILCLVLNFCLVSFYPHFEFALILICITVLFPLFSRLILLTCENRCAVGFLYEGEKNYTATLFIFPDVSAHTHARVLSPARQKLFPVYCDLSQAIAPHSFRQLQKMHGKLYISLYKGHT